MKNVLVWCLFLHMYYLVLIVPLLTSRRGDQRPHPGLVRQVRLQQARAPSQARDLFGQGPGVVARRMMMDRHVEPGLGQLQTDGPPDPPRPARDQGDAPLRASSRLSQPARTRTR